LCLLQIITIIFECVWLLKDDEESQANEEHDGNTLTEGVSNSSLTNALKASELPAGELHASVERSVVGSVANNVIEAVSNNELDAVDEVSQENFHQMICHQESVLKSNFMKGIFIYTGFG